MGKPKTWSVPARPDGKPKTIHEQLCAVSEEICDNYCKYPDICLAKEKDPDLAQDMLIDEYCSKCPMVIMI